jgi:hypothetical protein
VRRRDVPAAVGALAFLRDNGTLQAM